LGLPRVNRNGKGEYPKGEKDIGDAGGVAKKESDRLGRADRALTLFIVAAVHAD